MTYAFRFRGEIYHVELHVVVAIICMKIVGPVADMANSIRLIRGQYNLGLFEAKRIVEYIRAYGSIQNGQVRIGKPNDEVEYIEPQPYSPDNLPRPESLADILRAQMEHDPRN